MTSQVIFNNMIKSFQHKGLKKFYETGSTSGIITSHAKKLKIILGACDMAKNSNDLDLPAFKLHKLKGELQEFWSIAVNANWRVIFRFVGEDIELLDYLDYH